LIPLDPIREPATRDRLLGADYQMLEVRGAYGVDRPRERDEAVARSPKIANHIRTVWSQLAEAMMSRSPGRPTASAAPDRSAGGDQHGDSVARQLEAAPACLGRQRHGRFAHIEIVAKAVCSDSDRWQGCAGCSGLSDRC
jgi:hypothetical protein